MKRKSINVIALDFDGTLVESNHIKDQAFETIFSEWPEHQEKMMQWHMDRNIVDRHEKFRYFVEEVLCLKDKEEFIEVLASKFSKLTTLAICDCPMVSGAQHFLDYCVGKVPIFLISATPQKELEIIIEKRKLKKYFKKVHGAPINKVEIMQQILTDENAYAKEMVFIGDSKEDLQSSISQGVEFIGRRSNRPLNCNSYHIYPDFVKIRDYFDQVYEFDQN